MKPPSISLPGRGPRAESAAALVITLIFLVLIAIMILAMSDSLRVERGASVSYVNQLMSTQMAERGINHITATLNKETGDINRNWISQPGQLVLGAEEDDTSTNVDERTVLTGAVLNGTSSFQAKIVELHSGTSTVALSDPVLHRPNLNIATWDNTGEHLITGSSTQMQVKWIYVREDGTLDKDDDPDRENTANPIIGRYAFWADDESTKVNLNLAWSGTNAKNNLSAGSPTRISLAALPGFGANDTLAEAKAEAFHNQISSDNFGTLKKFFNSPTDACQNADFAAIIRQNKFNVTHYNHDPQTTFFNEKRIVLTTQKQYAGDNDFLDILVTDNTDPGWVTKVTNDIATDVISETKLNTTIKKLIDYIKRSDWPMVPATATTKSFQAKYFSNDSSRLAQLAIGIIEYVRSVESQKVLIEPIRVKYDAGTDKYIRVSGSVSPGADDTFIGSPRRIYMTEFGIWRASALAEAPNAGRVKVKLYVELHLSTNGGIDSVDLLEPEPGKRLCMYIFQADEEGYAFNEAGEDIFVKNDKKNSYVIEAQNIIGGNANRTLTAGGYRTVMFEFYYKPKTFADTIPFDVRYALTVAKDPAEAAKASRIEIAPLGNPPRKDGGSSGLPVTITTVKGITEPGPNQIPAIHSVMTDDPRVNATFQDWQENDVHTFGAANTPVSRLNSTSISAGTGKPTRDWDYRQANGTPGGTTKRVTDSSFRVPYPKGHTKNPAGLVRSAGELGFIHTGIEGRAAGGNRGVPWRTLRLQASGTSGGITEVPDWALMDLFTVPADVVPAAAALLSPRGTGAGRVNINNRVEPFGLDRSAPLKAVLLNARSKTTNPATRLTQTEVNNLVGSIQNFTVSGQKYGYLTGFDSPGEIVEIKGVADTGEDSEELVRSISNLITTRSNVFGIYTVGQSLRQTSSGKLQVTGEQRHHAILERYLESGKVRFRTVYFRNVNP